jgi:hypothetical protein
MRAPLLTLLAAALLAACGTTGDRPSVAPPLKATSPSPTTPVAGLGPEDRSFVDRVVALATAEDWAGIEELTAYTPVACIAEPSALEAPAPRCNPGEPVGTVAEGFRVGVCAGGYIRRDAGMTLIDPSGGIDNDFSFRGIVRAPAAGDDIGTQYYIVFAYAEREIPTGDGGTTVVTGDGFFYAVRDGRIVGSFRSCGSLDNSLGRDGRTPEYELDPS